MSSFAKISIRFAADLKEFSSQIQNANRDIKKVGAQMTKVGSGLTLGLTAPLTALGFVAVETFDKQAKAIAQVEAGLKSTQNAVGYTSTELQKFASDLQNNTIFGDEEILQGATAQLLTFTNIAGDQFKRTQEAALDLATRLDGDLKSASIQLGKALNDPVANLSALSRSGIQFSKEQKSTINALVATNRLAEAQTLILNELENQYGGSAAAAAKAGKGGLTQLKNILGDITEDFGKIILEAIDPFIAKLKDMALAFRALSPETKKVIAGVAALLAAVGPVLVTVGFLATNVIPGLITAFAALKLAMLATPWGLVAAGVGIAVAAFAIYNSESKKTIKSQGVIADVTKTASAAIAEQKAKVEELLFIARDENVSKSQRIKAINELNRISPKYLGNLNLETINTQAATDAIKKYNEALLQTAKAKAAQEKLQEIQSKIIDKELELSRRRKAIADDEANFLKNVSDNASLAKLQQENLTRAKALLTAETKQGTKALEDEAAALLEIIKLNDLQLTNTVSPSSGPELGRKKLAPLSLAALPVIISPLNQLEEQLPTQIEFIQNSFNGLRDNMVNVGEALNSSLQSAAANTAEFLGTFIGNLATGKAGFADLFNGLISIASNFLSSLGKALIAAGVAALSFKTLFANPFFAIAAGAAAIAAATIVKSIISNGPGGGQKVRAFADGGLVFGPTLGLVGEYAGARSNPEVIAPLNKLKDLIQPASSGGGYEPYIADVRLSGQDLLIALKRATEYRNRRR